MPRTATTNPRAESPSLEPSGAAARRPVLLLGHGASGTAVSMRPWVEELARHEVDAVALDLPRGRAERAVDVFRGALQTHPGAAVGGHSYGGRVASLLAAEQAPSALVLLSYPLHRPGHPEELRTQHWDKITCPVLVLSGERDPFARLELLRREANGLADVEIVTYPGLGHGLLPQAAGVSERIASFFGRIGLTGAPTPA